MQFFEWLDNPLAKAIGWTILHSLWQALLILALLRLLFATISLKNAGRRYIAGLCALCLPVLWSVLTFWSEYRSMRESAVAAFPYIGMGHGAAANPGSPIPFIQTTSLSVLLSGLCPYITFLWLTGALVWAVRLSVSSLQLRKFSRLKSIDHPLAIARLEMLQARMNIKKHVRLIVTTEVADPLTFGFFKAVVLIPLNYISQVPTEQLDMILAHELAHIRRRDYLVNLFQMIVEGLYFFNPFLRSISGMVRQEREYCCDDQAAQIIGNPTTMALALTNLKALSKGHRLVLSATPEKKSLYYRVYRLIEPSIKPTLSLKDYLPGFSIGVFLLIMLSQCARTLIRAVELPQATDNVTQILADNQAGQKEEVFDYHGTRGDHEIFLVSTVSGNPLYAWQDGSLLSEEQLHAVCAVIRAKKTVIMPMSPDAPQDEASFAIGRTITLNHQLDSLGQMIAAMKTTPSPDKNDRRIALLEDQRSQKESELKDISMQRYAREVKAIPVEVGIHDLLNKIVTDKEFTAEERKELNTLIGQKASL
ncbi:MAG TPA: M56 family metallopeptidase [Puia sp.]|nr:M56 family metallopeptidase [Puia sp.]